MYKLYSNKEGGRFWAVNEKHAYYLNGRRIVCSLNKATNLNSVKGYVNKINMVLKKIGDKHFDEKGNEWKFVNGEPVKVYPEVKENIGSDFDIDNDFLSDRFKDADKKVESGEIKVCNLDNDDCEACGS